MTDYGEPLLPIYEESIKEMNHERPIDLNKIMDCVRSIVISKLWAKDIGVAELSRQLHLPRSSLLFMVRRLQEKGFLKELFFNERKPGLWQK